MSHEWVSQLRSALENSPCVLVTLRQHKGSAPRESGARMIITDREVHGSIGGGNLEFQAIETAREMLSNHRHPGNASSVIRDPPASAKPRVEPYGLGPALNQCCGGSVELLFETMASPAPDWLDALEAAAARGDRSVLLTAVDAAEPRHIVVHSVGRQSVVPEELHPEVLRMLSGESPEPIAVGTAEGQQWWLTPVVGNRRKVFLFGAGHVGKAVVRALADLPFAVEWIDSREAEYPGEIPANAQVIVTEDPVAEVSRAPAGTTFIVMTHSHDLDEEVCHAILDRGDFEFLGLIGSISKRRRFEHRLSKRGIDEAALERMICPIGLPAIVGKEPATIALSLAAQLMSRESEK